MNALRYILPLAIILFALLFFRSRSRQTSENPPPKPAIAAKEKKAEAERTLTGFYSVYEQATEVLGSVKDGTSADAAISQLQALGPPIEMALVVWNQVPDSLRPKFRPIAAEKYETLKSVIDQTLSLPEVSEKLKPTTDHLLAHLKAFD